MDKEILVETGREISVGDLYDLLNTIAPFNLAEPWDNCGLQAGDFSWPVKKILVALDVTLASMDCAASINADALITHHPLMLSTPKFIDFSKMPGSAIAVSAMEKIAILSAHTNLDKVRGGLNDFFATKAGLHNISLLHGEEESFDGIGRIGELEKSIQLRDFAIVIKDVFHAENVRIAGSPEMKVKRVALCTGSGGSLLKTFFMSGADLFVTGDIKYHEARDIETAGLGLIDLGHFASEIIAVKLLAEKIRTLASENKIILDIVEYQEEKDPFVTL
ncbi:NGG1p interacting factor 3 protein, NIF3 [Desulfamplus magnetovallimortis]|uniref:GTP cyclohydrolase 1 type 2 homolog n=1 Tax=Desulfamplus magnetovallimortis TaxID=1246637 RepID=L0R428_9BACT|nr:Nif3-like dinuclear metal center hexameric protein [Desulfamplus magnetovallimortis]CCO06793.1 NGG1p interacting factor 3 protein, NIF3 [Desulfamplus magnetovallimortis BW-1]SLM32844.1 NGG1p interacting factor 3 protein, NIF3 [Desulfamplus magnetovallimortis]